ncbi:CoA transferase [Saccharopolyspora sp. HNM0986]|uniref:CaiB/BaiF CoA transferase family protein n=1 Tax=Saccharopolyspora galaxeae TaxID=2781241 RepID=UPI0019098BF2|nr:CaiB/BaiF CoA-transferase family protein [Saccharopolyspora sp. HNM0986]MBK0870788.1 CoA transferase [Saccharopolyspora sp. HNM0986]
MADRRDAHSASPDPGPLHGVTVVALEHAVAVPIATRQLADLGARVIKVERRDGGDFARHYDDVVRGGLSSVFLWTGRGKESITTDLKQPEGREVLHALLAEADVFIQNLSPGAVDRMGFGDEDLRTLHPRLIVVSNSGYGEPGPYSGRRAYDALVQCESGVVAATGTGDEMVKPGFSAADVASGMHMYSAVLMALYQRERTGQGTIVEVAMLDAITDWIANHLYYTQHNGAPPERVNIGHPSLVPYGAFATADGDQVVIGVQNDREWARFARTVLQSPALVDDPSTATTIARAEHRARVDALVNDATSRLGTAKLLQLLDEAQIANARVNSLAEAADHPQFTARDRWVEVESPVGPVDTLRQVIQERGKQYPAGPVPELGAHTDALLGELGYSAAAIADLRRREVV